MNHDICHDWLECLTLDIAQDQLIRTRTCESIGVPHLGFGGNFADLFLWDSAFIALWARHYADRLPVMANLDSLYRLQRADGHICRQYIADGQAKWSSDHPIGSAPPLLSWAELAWYRTCNDTDRLRRVYPHLARLADFNRRQWAADDGLFRCDPFGCGMDNLPRHPRGWVDDGQGVRLQPEHILIPCSPKYVADKCGDPAFRWNRQGRWIDTSAQMVLDARCLAALAAALGSPTEADAHRSFADRTADAINDLLWHEDFGFYVDRDTATGLIARRHIGGFWPLIAGLVPSERVDRVCAALTDPRGFGRLTPVPTLGADDPDFDPAGGYWRGGAWPPTTYMALAGVAAVGRKDLARRLANAALAGVAAVARETGTIWENYAPDATRPGKPAQRNFVGWGGCATVGLVRDVLDDRGLEQIVP